MKLYILIFFILNFSYAKTFTIEALSKDSMGTMLFKPSFLKVSAGDSIEFIPRKKDHNIQSVFTPKGSLPWKSEQGKKFTFKLTQEGIYIFECKNHSIMGMNGVIQVGEAQNLKSARNFLEKYKKKIPINKNRIDKSFALINP